MALLRRTISAALFYGCRTAVCMSGYHGETDKQADRKTDKSPDRKQPEHNDELSFNLTFLAPTFPTSPPWLNKDVDIEISLKESISKKNDNPELLRLMSLDHINR